MDADEFRAARKALDLTQLQLAALFGLDRRSIIDWEAGRAKIRPWVRLALMQLATEKWLRCPRT